MIMAIITHFSSALRHIIYTMRITRPLFTLSALFTTQSFAFCTRKPRSYSKLYLKNENLTFEDAQLTLHTYFFLPELKLAKSGNYEINKWSNTVSFVWSARQKEGVDPQPESSNPADNVQGKAAFSFRYQQLQSLLEVLPNSGSRTVIEKKLDKYPQSNQTLTIIDNPQMKAINYRLDNVVSVDPEVKKERVSFHFAYSQFRIFQILLRRSMFELSGMGLIYAVHREQQAGSDVRESLAKQLELEMKVNKESEEFFNKQE